MPVQLNKLKGSELLPQKKLTIPGKHCKCSAHGECECGCGADWTDYTTNNQAVDQLNQCAVSLDEEEQYKLMQEELNSIKVHTPFYSVQPESVILILLAKAICAHPDRVIKIERAE